MEDNPNKKNLIHALLAMGLVIIVLSFFQKPKEELNETQDDVYIQDSRISLFVGQQTKIPWETWVDPVRSESFLSHREELSRNNVNSQGQRRPYKLPGQKRKKMQNIPPLPYCMVKIGGMVTIAKIYERQKELLVRYDLPSADSYAEKLYCKKDRHYFVSIDSFNTMVRIEKNSKPALR